MGVVWLDTLRGALAGFGRRAGLFYSAADGHVHFVDPAGTDRKVLDSRDSGGGGGSGDVTGPASSTDSELPLFSGTTGKVLKRSSTLSGLVKLASGVVSAVTSWSSAGLTGTASRLAGWDGSNAPTTYAIGTTAGTIAAGDDSRFTDSRTPTGSAGGDLSGTYPNPGVAKVAGVTPSAYVLTLLDDADAATARTTLGVTQPSTTAYTSPGTTSAVAAPSWATLCYFRIVGAGGGGGSGRRGAASSLRGGAAGGAGGGYVEGWLHVSQLSGGTVDVVVGAGGTGGAPVTTNSTDGADGNPGGDSYLQTGGVKIAFAPGGAGGAKGTSAGGAVGGVATTATAQWPGGNGGSAGNPGFDSTGGAGGGGSGGSINGSNAYTSVGAEGGAGATSRTGSTTGAAAVPGAGGGTTGTAAATPSTYQPGGGGGGGEQGNTAGSQAGGKGGAGKYGGGGGGGGASTNGANSGGGENGADGFVILTWV